MASEGAASAATIVTTKASSAAEAKHQVNECEKEIATIKAKLKALGPASADKDAEAKNSLTVTLLTVCVIFLLLFLFYVRLNHFAFLSLNFVKTSGLPESADLRLALQLSSPIEELILTNKAEDKTVFTGIELGQAVLTVTATDAGTVPLGSSREPLDLASLIQFSAMSEASSKEHVVEKEVSFFNDVETSKEAVFSATLKLVFCPSAADEREELFELLNKATTKKAAAVEKLRQSALAASRQQQAAAGKSQVAKPAVKPGFLNKGGAAGKKEEKGIGAFIDKYFGPTSMLRQLGFVAKNYVIFAVATVLFHYKGDALALPPPV